MGYLVVYTSGYLVSTAGTCLLSMPWMDISQQSQMFSVLALSCLRSSAEKETPDSIDLKRFQAFWVMYVPSFALNFFLLYFFLINSEIYVLLPGLETMERGEIARFNGSISIRYLQRQPIY